MRIVDRVPLRRQLSLGLVLAAGSFVVAGCGDTIKYQRCKAISGDSQKAVSPSAYPLGDTQYSYIYSGNRQEVQDDEGTVAKIEHGYIIFTPDLPPLSQLGSLDEGNGGGDFNGAEIAIAIDTPQTGQIGLTSGCVTSAVENNVDVTAVKLPSQAF